MAKTKDLYQRGNVWWFRFTHPQTGEQIRRSCKTTDRYTAQRALDKARAQAWESYNNKSKNQKPRKLWLEAATRWLEDMKHKRSIATDSYRLGVLAEGLDYELWLDEIDNEFVRNVVVEKILKARKVNPATINRYITLLSSILNKAENEWGWLERAPRLSKPGKQGERQRRAWLNVNQFNRLYSEMSINSKHRADAMLLSLCTGLRLSNVSKLEWSQIDFVNKSIFIPKDKFKGRRDHTVPLNNTALKLLESWKNKHPVRVFTYRGEPFDKINLRWWHKQFDKLGINEELRTLGLLTTEKDLDGDYIERFVFHGMRHTFATWLSRANVPLEVIESIGGWSNGNVRQVKTYAHIADVNFLRPSVCKIDEVLEGKLII